jgi:hypothetical protein
MAESPVGNPLAFVSEVARYLCFRPEEVERAMRLDKLPYVEIAAVKKKVKRIPLRDFHAWLLHRAKHPAPSLESYSTFLADFNTVRKTYAPRS